MVRRAYATLTSALLAAGLAAVALGGTTERTAFSSAAPQQLRAVGKLTVPGFDRIDGRRRARDENCSASLVGPSTILTAWHCLEYYSDLSREPVFSLPLVAGQVPVAASRLADGGGMHADWALLRLSRPVRSIQPLPVLSLPATTTSVLLAGYARDTQLGAGGEQLTWQADCRLVDSGPRGVGTDCVTYKGASGGAVLFEDGIVGVISAGDSAETTWFVPSRDFLNLFRIHVR